MSKQDDKVFGEGIFFKQKENAPDFVLGAVSIKVDEFITFLKENVKKGWVNMDLKQSKGGKFYFQVDTWEPKPRVEEAAAPPKAKAKAKAAPPEEDPSLPF
tara:strand:+ start:167 stop:469 length:303 start_codon:yes stop_codon:yes gene_type:complete